MSFSKRKKKIFVIAHRGGGGEEENTIKAFMRAKKIGVDGVEMDVRQTKDGVLVLHHDRGIKVGRKRFWIDKINFHQLKEITEGKITTLEEAVRRLVSGKTYPFLFLDLKQEEIEKAVVSVLKKYKIRKVFVCSPDIWSLKKFEELFPRAVLVLSYHPKDRRDLASYKVVRGLALFIFFLLKPFLFRLIKRKTAQGIKVASLNRRLINLKIVDFFHSQKIKVFAWEVSREKQMRRLLKMGVDGVITRRPDLLKKVIKDIV